MTYSAASSALTDAAQRAQGRMTAPRLHSGRRLTSRRAAPRGAQSRVPAAARPGAARLRLSAAGGGLLPSGGAGAASGAAPGSCLPPPPRDKKVRGRSSETQSTKQETAATLRHVEGAMAAAGQPLRTVRRPPGAAQARVARACVGREAEGARRGDGLRAAALVRASVLPARKKKKSRQKRLLWALTHQLRPHMESSPALQHAGRMRDGPERV